MTEDTLTDKGKYNMKAFDEINSNNDSIVIFSTPTSINHFESFISPHQKFYVAKFDGFNGISNDKLHETFEFNELSSEEISNVLENDANHTVYLLEAYGKFNISDNYRNDVIFNFNENVKFYRVN